MSEGDTLGDIARSEQGANHPGDSMHPWHDSRIADLEAHVAALVGERDSLRQQLEGAVSRDVLIEARDALHQLCLDRGSTDGYVAVFDRINAALGGR
jgi:hypothetical protein